MACVDVGIISLHGMKGSEPGCSGSGGGGSPVQLPNAPWMC